MGVARMRQKEHLASLRSSKYLISRWFATQSHTVLPSGESIYKSSYLAFLTGTVTSDTGCTRGSRAAQTATASVFCSRTGVHCTWCLVVHYAMQCQLPWTWTRCEVTATERDTSVVRQISIEAELACSQQSRLCAVHSADTAVAYVFTHRCMWQRRDAEVRKTFVFFVNNFQTVNVVS